MLRSTQREPWGDLYAYWRRRHVAGRPPSRRDIDPIIDIPKLTRHLMLIEVSPDGYRYLVVGSELVERHGVNYTGRRVDVSEGKPAAMLEFTAALDTVSREQEARLLVYKLPPHVAAQYVMLIMPLIGPDGTTTHILGGSFYDGYFEPDQQFDGILIKAMGLENEERPLRVSPLPGDRRRVSG